jgi:hypothetical protein
MPTSLPDRVRLPFSFDPALLVRDLERLASVEWISHFVTANYDGDWSVIPLRGTAGARHPVMMIYPDPNATEFEDTAMLRNCPYFREVLGSFAGSPRDVRLMRLAPGSVIKEHTDHDLSAEAGVVRLHIPIVTNSGVTFLLNGSRVVMEAGSVWYLRLSDPHSVVNAGDTARVHMVIDANAGDWIRSLAGSCAQGIGC